MELRTRRDTLRRWRKQFPGLEFTVDRSKGDIVWVTVVTMPNDLTPASKVQGGCLWDQPERYGAGNARGKKFWGVNVIAGDRHAWLDNFDSRDDVESAAWQWFLVQGIDPRTVERGL